MPVNSTHPDYDAHAAAWQQARDLFGGEVAVKAAGERYLPRLDSQTDAEYANYRARASFFNATARTAEGYVGLIFRRDPIFKHPGDGGVGQALETFVGDADLTGTTLGSYARHLVSEVIAVGRAGTLVDWVEEAGRAAVVGYAAEQILNWRTDRVNGRLQVTLVVLSETRREPVSAQDAFELRDVNQVRVLRLTENGEDAERHYVVEVWRERMNPKQKGQTEWVCVETRTPRRQGRPLTAIPFVFHGPRHSRADVDALPLANLMAVNLDHYRLDADYKHGLHFTALPTAWVSGFDVKSSLRIGSSTAWMAEAPGATAGFLEFRGQGLTSFERALDRDERLMAVLGTRVLEAQKRVGESAEAIELRQSGEHSVLGGLAVSVGDSVSDVLRWVCWWHSTAATAEDISEEQVHVLLNTDFSTRGMTSDELIAVVNAWQAGAISQRTMFEVFRRGEVLFGGRTDEEEARLAKQSYERGTGNGERGMKTGPRSDERGYERKGEE